jgi:hydrogenase expression/formation protein HypC
MCLGIPAKILKINGDTAKVDFGGVTREVDISLVDAQPNDYVIIHAGFAIQILDEKEAQDTMELFKQLLEADEASKNETDDTTKHNNQ